MQKIRVIPRLERGGTPILFLPDDPARPGRIVCYTHVGQHSEADVGYYRQNTKPDKSNDCADLLREYANLGPCELVICKRRSYRT